MFEDILPDPHFNPPLRRVALSVSVAGFVLLGVGLLARYAVPRFTLGLALLAVGLIALLAAALLFSIDHRLRLLARQKNLDRLLTHLRGSQRRERLLAVEELRRRGWLNDGALRGIDLGGIDLQGASLSSADLQGADLRGANLRGADLHWVDLRHADLSGASLVGANLLWANLEGVRGLTDEQLAQVYILRRAVLPEGRLYDGRYCLPGDLDDAARDRIKADDAEGLARWYEVSLDDYRRGQEWAGQHPHILQSRLK